MIRSPRNVSRLVPFAIAALFAAGGCAGSTGVDEEGSGGSAALASGGGAGRTGSGGAGAVESGGSGAIGVGGSAAVGTGGSGALGVGGSAAVGIGGGPCTDSDQMGEPLVGQAPSDPGLRGTASGINGSFSDECDAAGNLIEYVCEVVSGSGGACVGFGPVPAAIPVPACPVIETGNVVPLSVDCGGGCVEGACESHCPETGDQLRYVAIAGTTVTLENVTLGRTYSCSVIFDNASDTYDCAASARLGTTVSAYSFGLANPFCNGSEVGNIGTDDPTNATAQECTFQCTAAP